MRRSSNATIRSPGAARSRLATAPDAVWWPRRAARPVHSACGQPCRRSPPCRNVRTSLFVLPCFDVYRAVSRRIHRIFAHSTALIEPPSLDESCLDVARDLRGLQTASAAAKEIRARIFDETGLKLPREMPVGQRLGGKKRDLRPVALKEGLCDVRPTSDRRGGGHPWPSIRASQRRGPMRSQAGDQRRI